MTWLFMTLARSGWGETVLGIRIARRLVARGDRVVFLTHPQMSKAFFKEPFEVELTQGEQGVALEQRIHRLIAHTRPQAIVLADLLMTVTALLRQQAPTALASTGLPVIGIDTWHLRELGGHLDMTPTEHVRLSPHLVHFPRRLVPVPFVHPDVPFAATVLPEGQPFSGVQRRAVRDALGLPHGPLIAMATAGWQHRSYPEPAMTRFQQIYPRILARILAPLNVPVVHVGPRPLDLPGVTVFHRDQLPAPVFEDLIGCSDLLLSTNAASATNATAAVRWVPVMTFVHTGPPDELLPWPFHAWPVGWARSMGILLKDNPWSDVLNRREITDLESMEAAIEGALPDGWSRDGLLDRAGTVLDRYREVATPEQVLDAHVHGATPPTGDPEVTGAAGDPGPPAPR